MRYTARQKVVEYDSNSDGKMTVSIVTLKRGGILLCEYVHSLHPNHRLICLVYVSCNTVLAYIKSLIIRFNFSKISFKFYRFEIVQAWDLTCPGDAQERN